MNNQHAAVRLSSDDGHQRYVALVSSPVESPRVAVGAFTPPDAPDPVRTLFMINMDLDTARSYAEAILATCRMADSHVDDLQAPIKH